LREELFINTVRVALTVYLMTLIEQQEMDTFLEEALATSRIRQSKLLLGAPVFFIKKKDAKLHFVQDYRALNAIMHKNHYPLLLINNLIHHLKSMHYFTKLNMCWGYNNVHIQEGNKWKATFCTNRCSVYRSFRISKIN
jgi:hypothetical protein